MSSTLEPLGFHRLQVFRSRAFVPSPLWGSTTMPTIQNHQPSHPPFVRLHCSLKTCICEICVNAIRSSQGRTKGQTTAKLKGTLNLATMTKNIKLHVCVILDIHFFSCLQSL